MLFFFFFQAEDGIRDDLVTGVQTCALPICTLVGAPLKGRVLIVDDVMSAGTAARESIAIIRAAGATPHAVAIALDRQEMATENGQDVPRSAVQDDRNQLGMQDYTIAKLADLVLYLEVQG